MNRVTIFTRFAMMLLAALATGGAALALDRQAVVAKRPPKTLAGFAAFAGPGIAAPAKALVPYDVLTPLFSDGALKFRQIALPEGEAAQWSDREAFRFPVGTAVFKTFAFPADFREPDRNIRLIETRVLLRQEKGWVAWPYRWNEAQTEATLAITGGKVPVEFVERDGTPVRFTYSIPNKNQCKGCHSVAGELVPIGLKARHLNRDYPSDTGAGNQIAQWQQIGILDGVPSQPWPQVADWLDETIPVDKRARAWLDINCAHCHRRDGPASNSGLYLDAHESDPIVLGIGKRPVAAGKGGGGGTFDIEPGKPDRSILWHRVASTEPGIMMPELGRSRADPAAVEMLRRWIAEMDD